MIIIAIITNTKIAPDKLTTEVINLDNFCYYCTKTYLVGTHLNCLNKVITVSTHKICFDAKNNKPYFWNYSFILTYALSFSSLWANSADDKLIIISYYLGK